MLKPDGTFRVGSPIRRIVEESLKNEKETWKPHPIFVEGEELEIRGGKFRVHKIEKNRLILEPIPY